MSIDIDKLKALALAASKGPWQWELNHQNKRVALVGGRPTFDKTVMDFERWGMGGAAPRFNDAVASGEYNIMERVEKYGAKVPGREHHANWFMDVGHPDAQWIAAANPAAVLELIAEVERLRAATQPAPIPAQTGTGELEFFIVRKPGMCPRIGIPIGDTVKSLREWYEGNPGAEIDVVHVWANGVGCQHVQSGREVLMEDDLVNDRPIQRHPAEATAGNALTDETKDAARYRFLRKGFGDFGPDVDLHNAFVDGNEKMDAAIDAAMAAQCQKGDEA